MGFGLIRGIEAETIGEGAVRESGKKYLPGILIFSSTLIGCRDEQAKYIKT
jgi:hypothetical protein